jgi:menaquinone-dependent protoporphyrinogen oxidase
MMKVLIGVASRHGSTSEIGERIARRLRHDRHDVTVLAIGDRSGNGDVADLDQYDAYVVGSAVYEGHWMRAGRRFLLAHADAMRGAPVWLFSSGPVGDDQVGVEHDQVAKLVDAVDALDHRVFKGRLDRSELGRVERWIVDVVRAREGDYRDWAEIDAWSEKLAAHLDGMDMSRQQA